MEEEESEQTNHGLVLQEGQGQGLYYKQMSPTQRGLGVIGQFHPSRSFWGGGRYTQTSPQGCDKTLVRCTDFALQDLWIGATHIYVLESSEWDSKLWGKCKEGDPGDHVGEAMVFSKVFQRGVLEMF